MYIQVYLLNFGKFIQVTNIMFGVSDIVMLSSGQVLLGFGHYLNISNGRIVKRHSHLNTNLSQLISYVNIGSDIHVPSFDTNHLSHDHGSILISNSDNIP